MQEAGRFMIVLPTDPYDYDTASKDAGNRRFLLRNTTLLSSGAQTVPGSTSTEALRCKHNSTSLSSPRLDVCE